MNMALDSDRSVRHLLISALVSLLFLGRAQAQGLIAKDECQTPTVAAVQGDGANLDTASSFLTGCPHGCQDPSQAPQCHCFKSVLHVPKDWLAVQLQLDQQMPDYSRFFVDKSAGSAQQGLGLDQSSPNGLEGERLLFFAGHGDPNEIVVFQEKHVDLGLISLGDGRVRYLWALSCNLFAHGPSIQFDQNHAADFGAPEKFDARLVGPTHENVFYRWTRDYDQGRGLRPLNRRLRLACGGSSRLSGGAGSTHLLWHYFSNLGLGPADSFLLGQYKPETGEIPLCISQGGPRPGNSGLYDARFEKDPLAIASHVYIEYPVAGDERDPLTQKVADKFHLHVTKMAASPNSNAPFTAILKVGLTPTPAVFQGINFTQGHALDYGFVGGSAKTLGLGLDWLTEGLAHAPISSDDVCVKRHPGTGAIVFSWRPATAPPTLNGDLTDAMAASLINHFLAAIGITPGGIVFREVRPIEMHVDGAPAATAQASLSSNESLGHSEKCRYLRLTMATVDGDIPVFGEGGEALVAVCPQPEGAMSSPGANAQDVCQREALPLLSLAYSNRQVEGTEQDLPFGQKSLNEAKADALKQLEATKRSLEAYGPDPVRWRWGYRAAPMHCEQSKMYLVYQFDFAPKPQEQFRELPPVTIEVPAHHLKNGATRVEDTWECSSEKPGDD